jgi:hypothetical protein
MPAPPRTIAVSERPSARAWRDAAIRRSVSNSEENSPRSVSMRSRPVELAIWLRAVSSLSRASEMSGSPHRLM